MAKAKKKLPVALQLYSVREDCKKDFPATLRAVAKMGYDGVEFAGYYGLAAGELRKMLDDLGLKAAGTHIGLDTLMGEKVRETVEFNRTLGNRFLVVPGVPGERFASRESCLKLAEDFDRVAEALRPEGMYVGYHNHSAEFKVVDGERLWDTLFGNTRDLVMQLDTGNALHGGATSVDILRRYPGRAKTVHLKEYASGYDKALIGEGDIPWKEVLEACETIGGTEWYVIEQESYAFAPLECVDKCLQALRKMGR